MQMRDVYYMLRDGRVEDLSKHIKSGKSISEMCFVHIAAQLQSFGVTKDMLMARGAIVELPVLLDKIGSVLAKGCDDEDTKFQLKQYNLVLSNSKNLWKTNQLNAASELATYLDEKAFGYLYDMWHNYLSNGRFNRNAYLAHVENFVDKQVTSLAECFRERKIGNVMSEQHFNHYKDALVNVVLSNWQEDSYPACLSLGAKLTSLVQSNLLDGAMQNSLGEVMQTRIADKLRESLRQHFIVNGDMNLYPQLMQNAVAIRGLVQGRHPTNPFGDFTNEIIEEIVKSYHSINAAANDIRKILREEVIPKIMLNFPMTREIKRAAVLRAINDYQAGSLPLEIGNYIAGLINFDISAEIRRDIYNDQVIGQGLVQRHIKHDIAQLKLKSYEIVQILKDVELFAEIQAQITRIADKLDIRGSVVSLAEVVKSQQEIIGQLRAELAHSNASVAKLEKSVEDLKHMLEAMIALQQGQNLAAPTAPPVQAIQPAAGLFNFFGKSTADAKNSGSGPSPSNN